MRFTVMFPVEPPLGPTDAGILLGLLVGEGSFGGDGRQPQVTLRMHTRHEPLFRWLQARFPEAKLYGPYHHGGRNYYQFMWRGAALRRHLLPILDALPWAELDPYSHARYERMKERYVIPGAADSNTTDASPESRPGAGNAPASVPSSSTEGSAARRRPGAPR